MRTRDKIIKYCTLSSRSNLQCCCCCRHQEGTEYTYVRVLNLKFLNEDDSFPKKIYFGCKIKGLDSAVNVQEVSRTCVVFRQLSKKDKKRQKQRSRILQSLHLKRTLNAGSAERETEEHKSRLPVNFFAAETMIGNFNKRVSLFIYLVCVEEFLQVERQCRFPFWYHGENHSSKFRSGPWWHMKIKFI